MCKCADTSLASIKAFSFIMAASFSAKDTLIFAASALALALVAAALTDVRVEALEDRCEADTRDLVSS